MIDKGYRLFVTTSSLHCTHLRLAEGYKFFAWVAKTNVSLTNILNDDEGLLCSRFNLIGT